MNTLPKIPALEYWHIPPAGVDFALNLKGHIGALRALKKLVDDLGARVSGHEPGGESQSRDITLAEQARVIRSNLEEHVRRFIEDFAGPEEPPLEEAIDIVRRGQKQYPRLDKIALAQKLRLTPSITGRSLRRLKKENTMKGNKHV